MRDAITILSILAVLVVACDERAAPPDTGPPADLRPLSIRVDGPTDVIADSEVRFTALQTWSDGSTRDVTASAQWSSSNPSVLSVSGGLAMGLAPGEARVFAHLADLPVNSKGVRVLPAAPGLSGSYRLTIGGGPCNPTSTPPLPNELRERTYTAFVDQSGLNLFGDVPKVGVFGGRIINPQVRFGFVNFFSRSQRRASVVDVPHGGIQLAVARYEPPMASADYIRVRNAYSGSERFAETLPNGYRLVITGEALTTMSPSGFAGTFSGTLALHEPSSNGNNLHSVCGSPSHGFTLVRN
jgi:hypothetical protein